MEIDQTTTVKTKTERVHVAPVNGPRRTIYLDITKETDLWLVGRTLDKGGDWNGNIDVIDKSCITKRTPQEMNLFYARFEDAK